MVKEEASSYSCRRLKRYLGKLVLWLETRSFLKVVLESLARGSVFGVLPWDRVSVVFGVLFCGV